MGTVQRIGLRRTQAVDDLLNGIWKLRPELKRKNTTTILLGLEAFLRECKAHAQFVNSPSVTVEPVSVKTATVAELKPMVGAEKNSAVSDDIEW